jgi:hypothetical protein
MTVFGDVFTKPLQRTSQWSGRDWCIAPREVIVVCLVASVNDGVPC